MVSTFPLVAAGLFLGQAAAAEPLPAPGAPSAKVYVYQNGTLVPVPDGPKSAPTWRSPSADAPPSRPLRARIQSWFGKHPADPTPPPGAISGVDTTTKIMTAPPMPPASAPAPAPAAAPGLAPTAAPPGEFPKKLPTTQVITPKTEVIVVPQGSTIVLPKTGGIMPAKTEPVRTVALKPAPAAATSAPMSAPTPIRPANVQRIGRDEKFAWVTGQIEIEKGQYVLYYATPETVDPHHGRIVLSGAKTDLRTFHSGDLISVHGQLHTGRGGAVYQVTSADLIERAKH